jgi:cell division protein FtsI (penicillin-binding protein 3)
MPRPIKLNLSLDGALNKAVEKSKLRLVLVILIVILTYSAVAVKTAMVSLSGKNYFKSLSITSQPQKVIKQDLTPEILKKNRNSIYDRNGILIASNLVTSSLYAHPQEMIEHQYAATLVHKILPELSVESLKQKFLSGKKFLWIKRNLTPKQKYEINALGIPGLYFENEFKRIYPHKNLFAQTIGMVGVDGQGLSGMEKFLDKLMATDENKELQKADGLKTTLDVRVQNIVHEELQKQMETHKAVAAAGIVLDINTGEILALVSLPDFDPNVLSSLTPENFFNYATLGSYELGSTFKPITFVAAFEKGLIKMDSKFDASTSIKVGRFTITDYHPENRWLNVPEIMMYSSNIGTARIAEKLGAENLKEVFRKLGFNAKSEIEIQEKSLPRIPKIWGESTLYTASFGHGVAVSPMHLITAFATIINGGTIYKPTLLQTNTKPKGNKIFKEDVSKNMRKLMRLVVTRGTATKANIAGYLIGGKTGTAEKIAPNGKYSGDLNVTSFVGAFPMNNPKYAILTLFDEPKASKDSYGFATAGWVAAPPAGKIISRIAPILKIMPQDENDPKVKQALDITGIEIE